MTRLEREMLARIKERLAGLDPAAAEKLAALYDESGAGAIYLLENQTAFETALSSGEDPTSALTLIEYCTFPGVWDNVMSALDA